MSNLRYPSVAILSYEICPIVPIQLHMGLLSTFYVCMCQYDVTRQFL